MTEAGDLSDSPRLDGVAVLVVDDDPSTLEVVRAMLERRGARVVIAHSATEALAAFARHPPDVLVADLNMPEVDGYELIERVRALDPARGGRVPARKTQARKKAPARKKVRKAS